MIMLGYIHKNCATTRWRPSMLHHSMQPHFQLQHYIIIQGQTLTPHCSLITQQSAKDSILVNKNRKNTQLQKRERWRYAQVSHSSAPVLVCLGLVNNPQAAQRNTIRHTTLISPQDKTYNSFYANVNYNLTLSIHLHSYNIDIDTTTNIRGTILTTLHRHMGMTQRDGALHPSNYLQILHTCKNITLHQRVSR